MDSLIVATFKDPEKAEDVRRNLIKNIEKKIVAPEETSSVSVDALHHVHLSHVTHFTAPASLGGGFLGILSGLIILNPLFALVGGITGAAVGAILGALEEVGIDEHFMKDLAAELTAGSSALFVIVRSEDPGTVKAFLEPHSEHIFTSTLSHSDERRLKAALREVEEAEKNKQ